MRKVTYFCFFLVLLFFLLSAQFVQAFLVESTVEINSSTTNGPTLTEENFYGVAVENIGDLDGDDVVDIAVGARGDNNGEGTVHIHYMNTDGSIHSTIEINSTTPNGPVLAQGYGYGTSIANIGDLDDDGVDDLAVGAVWDDGNGEARGALNIHYMNSDGSIDSTVEINEATPNGPSLVDYDFYGQSVENIGDLDGDGVIDLAVGASGDGPGVVYIHYMNTDGSIDSTVEINSSTTNGPVNIIGDDSYGYSIANIGDLDGDGVIDLAVGALLDHGNGDNRGTFYIHYMNTDGSIDSTIGINDSTIPNGPSLADDDEYGSSVASIGDADGDGVNDIAVGARGDNGGCFYIHYMNTDRSIHSTVKIDDSTINGPSVSSLDEYGQSIANIGDLDGDGKNDIVVGAQRDSDYGHQRGAIHIHFMDYDEIAPILSEVTPVSSPTNDTTPNYTFNTDEAGTISYGGSCSSSTTSAILGNNTITFNALSDGTYSNCTITVTDLSSNASNSLLVNSFIVDIKAPILSEVTPVSSPTNDTTPNYTFNTDEAGTISYGGSCSSSTTSAILGNNTITFNALSDGTYSNCTITVTDELSNISSPLNISSFTITNIEVETTPVYRFWSPQNRAHFFTISEAEKDYIMATYTDYQWRYEGIAYYVPNN